LKKNNRLSSFAFRFASSFGGQALNTFFAFQKKNKKFIRHSQKVDNKQ